MKKCFLSNPIALTNRNAFDRITTSPIILTGFGIFIPYSTFLARKESVLTTKPAIVSRHHTCKDSRDLTEARQTPTYLTNIFHYEVETKQCPLIFDARATRDLEANTWTACTSARNLFNSNNFSTTSGLRIITKKF